MLVARDWTGTVERFCTVGLVDLSNGLSIAAGAIFRGAAAMSCLVLVRRNIYKIEY